MNKAQRGIAARHLLDNELLKEVLNTLDGTYHAKWRIAATPEAREDLHRYVKVLEHITSDIQQIVVTGKLEEQRIADLEGRRTLPALDEWRTRFA